MTKRLRGKNRNWLLQLLSVLLCLVAASADAQNFFQKGNTTQKVKNSSFSKSAGRLTKDNLASFQFVKPAHYASMQKIQKTDISNMATITFDASGSSATGVAPADVEVEIGSQFTIPVNRTLYKDGSTLTAWTDGTNTYATGETITVPDAETVTLMPVFTANEVALADRTQPVTVEWNFRRDAGAPSVKWQNQDGLVWVAQATINGKVIDVALPFSTKPGKFDNTIGTEWCQLNEGTTFHVPSCKGATISMEAYSNITTTSIDGQTDYTSGQTISYIITSSAESVDVVIGDGSYYRYIKAVYPVSATEEVPDPVTIPEGLVVEDYTLRAWHYRTTSNGWTKISKGQYIDNDEVINIKVGFDGRDVYIQGFFDRFIPEAWVKGTMSEDETTITFNTQYYGTDGNGYNHYLFGFTGEQDSSGHLLSGDVAFQYDKATSTLRLSPSTEVADSEYGDIWMSWDYYDYVVITKGYQEQESLVVPPEGIHLEDYSFSASVVTYNSNNDIVENPTTFGVKVGFDGDDVYIKGLCQQMPEAWVKGSLANGKLTIPTNQYMGSAENTEVFLTGFPVNATDWMDLEDIIFDYDSNEKLFSGSTEQFILVNASKVRIYWFTEFLNVTITRLAEQSVKPEAPQLVEFGNYENNSGYLRFNMPVTDIYGNALLEDKLYYQILVDDEHNISGYTFIPAKYETIENDMTLVPYTFIDNKYFDVLFNYETRVTDKIVYILDEEPFTKNRIGLRSVYYGGGIENASDTIWYFIREFADVLAMNEARQLLADEIEHANDLLNDNTKARGKEELLSAISLAQQILENTTNPQDIGIINQAIETLQQAEEAYISLNLMIDTEEWMVLRDYYQSSNNGEGWTTKWDFSSNVPSVATLPGATAYNGHVTMINLSNNGLKGSFPVSFLLLPYLEGLNLSDNQLNGNVGEAVDAYMQAHQNSTIAIKTIDISNNQLSGNVGQYAKSLINLTTLDASGNCFDEVTPMIPATVTTLNLGSQTIDKTLELNLANLTGEYILSQVPNILLYNHALQTYSTNIRLLCTTADNTWGMRLISQNGQVILSAVSEDNAFHGQSGDILNVSVLKSNNTLEGSTLRLKLSFEQGDGNFDGKINVLDLQTTINYMFEEYVTKPFNFTAANLWLDDIINVQDAVSIVNLLLEPASASARMQNRAKRASEVSSEATACVFIENGKLMVSSAVPVASFDIVVSSGQEWTMAEGLSQIGFTCTTRRNSNQIHLVGYSLNGTALPVGQTMIGETGNGTVSYAMLADEDAQEIPSTTNTNTTGIQSAFFDSDSKSYRLSIGADRAILIDANGKKTMTKNEK